MSHYQPSPVQSLKSEAELEQVKVRLDDDDEIEYEDDFGIEYDDSGDVLFENDSDQKPVKNEELDEDDEIEELPSSPTVRRP